MRSSNGEDTSIRGRSNLPRVVFEHKLTYDFTRYGTLYLFLQLVPGLSMFFLLTAAASSALWAADMESERREQEGSIRAPQYTDQLPDDPV